MQKSEQSGWFTRAQDTGIRNGQCVGLVVAVSSMRNSTLRLAVRPSSLLLSSKGTVGPKPALLSRLLLTPVFTSAVTTAAARCRLGFSSSRTAPFINGLPPKGA